MPITTTIRRILAWSAQGLSRNKLLSLTTVIGVALILFFTTILDGVNFLSQTSIREISEKIDLTLEISDGIRIDDPVVVNLRNALSNVGLGVEAVSKEQALEGFKRMAPPDLVQFLDEYGVNPLPASLLVRAGTLEQYQQVENIVSRADYRGVVNMDANENGFLQQKERIEKIGAVTAGISRGVLSVRVLFWIIAVVIIVNTLQIVISHRREEIAIMQLVGAPHSIIMGPFILEGVAYALIGVLLGTGLFAVALRMVGAGITSYLPGSPLDPFFAVLSEHYYGRLATIIATDLLIFGCIGVVASLIALLYRVNLLPERWFPRFARQRQIAA